MSTASNKFAYLLKTKSDIKNAIIAKNIAVPANTRFRDYATLILSISSEQAPILVGNMTADDLMLNKTGYSNDALTLIVGTWDGGMRNPYCVYVSAKDRLVLPSLVILDSVPISELGIFPMPYVPPGPADLTDHFTLLPWTLTDNVTVTKL